MFALLNNYISYAMMFVEEERKASEHFKQKAKEAEKKYWDACKYPRKIKKRMRQEALVEYSLYSELSKPMFSSDFQTWLFENELNSYITTWN